MSTQLNNFCGRGNITNLFFASEHSWGYLILLYIFTQASRCIVVGALYPFLRYFGYGLDVKEAVILICVPVTTYHISVLKQEACGGIVFLTLIVNGSTTQFFLHFLDMDKLTGAKVLLNYFPESAVMLPVIDALALLEAGLLCVQSAYWGMLDEGRISQSTANLLMQYVDEAIDVTAHESLCDWKGLKSNVHFPNYYKFLQTSDSVVASTVITESEAEGEEARNFSEDVRITFPQVLRVVKTRQVTYSILNHLLDYLQNLEKVGLLEEKEMIHHHDVVQESAFVLLAKLLVPQIFEKMALQDLRALVAERSSMKTYITGETIDVPHQSIGFLLTTENPISRWSEGSVTPRKNIEEGRKITRQVPPAQAKNTDSKEGHINDDLSDEDEILVIIDSPIGQSFNQAS
ncbi:hypothetical protein V6N11_075329 [Hibiscus sabdariffa]|uniref:Uncharacterized protein n=1 Tax=Hibiscus sabdariffa TaxID=183260 RepID=A0ABR2R6D9_9ROSI